MVLKQQVRPSIQHNPRKTGPPGAISSFSHHHTPFSHDDPPFSDDDIPKTLPSGIAKYGFRNLYDLTEKVNRLRSRGRQYVAFLEVPAKIIQATSDDSSSVFGGLITYEPATRTLLIKIPSPEHEIAASELLVLLTRKFEQMGVKRELRSTGSTRVGRPGWVKEPDVSWQPKSLGPDINDPSLTIEVAMSETRSRLDVDAR
jgi:hypothetical protein